jgi:hypothetical protein
VRDQTSTHEALTLCPKFYEHFSDPAVYLAGASRWIADMRRTGPKVGASPSTGIAAQRPAHARAFGFADRRPGASTSRTTQGRLNTPFARGIEWSSMALHPIYNKRIWAARIAAGRAFLTIKTIGLSSRVYDGQRLAQRQCRLADATSDATRRLAAK